MPSSNLHNEKELLLRIAEGDEKAFKIIFTEYWPRIYSIALIFMKVPELAEDATQEVFTQLWIKREMLTAVTNFKAYLFSMARNLILNTFRTKVFSGNFDDYLQEYFADADSDPSAQLNLKEVHTLIEKGINQLTPQQQKVFRMSRFQGMSHKEIAHATGLSLRTVKNYMVAAILALRTYLHKQSGFIPVLLWMLLFL